MNKTILQLSFFVFVISLFVLPKDAKVLIKGVSDKEWAQVGEMDCSLVVAIRQWEAILGHQGWHEVDQIKLNSSRYVSVWKKKSNQITLLIWEKEIGKSGFSWGKLSESKKK